MKAACKVILWIMLVQAGLAELVYLTLAVLSALLGEPPELVAAVLRYAGLAHGVYPYLAVLELVAIAGLLILLFGKKRVGFYLLIGANVASAILNYACGMHVIPAMLSIIPQPFFLGLFLFHRANDGVYT